MPEDVTPEVEQTPAEGQVSSTSIEESPEAEVIPEGQGDEGQPATDPDTATDPFDQELSAFYEKKGWKTEEGLQQLLKSYQSLESKMGNLSEVEQKAAAWDAAQEQLAQLEEDQKFTELTQEQLGQLPVQQLAQQWQSGKIGLADIPPNRQAEVFQFVQNKAAADEAAVEAEAKDLAERHPILKDPKIASMAARLIETGMTGPDGKEMTPDEIVTHLEEVSRQGERNAEEKHKKDVEELKAGDLERTGTAVNTTPSQKKVKSVRDAFNLAKEKTGYEF